VKGLAKKAATAGVGVITASAIAFAPSIQPSPPPAPEIQLTAQVQTATSFDPFSITDWLGRIVIPPSLGAPFPTPQFLPQVAPTSLGNFIINAYNGIESWVRYGFDLAAYAVGWIPYVGWLAPQITIFYNLGERITRSIAYNLGNFLNGQIGFGQGLTNVGIDTINSFIFFANDQIAFWLPPLPPIPPLPGGSNTLAIPNTPSLAQPFQTVAKQTTAAVAVKRSPPTDTSNLLRTIDPFRIATSASSKSRDTTTTSPNALRDVFNTPIGTTSAPVDTLNPSTGNTNKGGLIGTLKRVTDSLTGGIGGAKRATH
jgi:hypothetical protein